MDELDLSRFFLSFLFVLGLIGALAYGLRRYGHLAKKMVPAQTGGGRLQVVETYYLDTRRRLVLIRRDDVEHLLLLADGRETVVEQGIKDE